MQLSGGAYFERLRLSELAVPIRGITLVALLAGLPPVSLPE
jgi:hypothetical protein